MAKRTLSQPAFVSLLYAALQRDMPGASITTEHLHGQRYRFVVIWDRFNGVGHPERQKRVWRIVERVVPKEDIWDVGMILTIAGDELASYSAEDLPRQRKRAG